MQRQNKTVVAYVRVSSNEAQYRQLHSLPAQVERIEHWAKRDGAAILRIFREKESGEDFNRAEFKRMWQYVRDNRRAVTHVICTDVTRFGREGSEYLSYVKRFNALGIEVNFVDEWFDFNTPEVWSLFYFRIGNAEAERLRTSKRTRQIKASIRENGYYADTAPAPYRYSEERDANGRKLLLPDDPAFTYYRRALRLYANREITQARAIAMVSDKHYRIRSSSFSRLLRNPVIYGAVPIYTTRRDGTREMVDTVPGKHEALVSYEQWERIQAKLNRKRPAHAGQVKRRFNPHYPVKQLMWCPDCGARLRAYGTINRHGQRYGYYDCACKTYRTRADEVHQAVAAALDTFRVKPEHRPIVERAASKAMAMMGHDTRKAQADAKRELNALQAKAEQLKADYMKLGADMYAELMRDVQAQIRKAESTITEIEHAKELAQDTRRKLIGLLDNFGQWWATASPFQQFEAARMVFPQGFTVVDGQVRTLHINQLLRILCTQSTSYTSSETPTGAPIVQNCIGGRRRAVVRTLYDDENAAREFLYALDVVA